MITLFLLAPILLVVVVLSLVFRLLTLPFRLARLPFRRNRFNRFAGSPYGRPRIFGLLPVVALFALDRFFGRRW